MMQGSHLRSLMGSWARSSAPDGGAKDQPSEWPRRKLRANPPICARRCVGSFTHAGAANGPARPSDELVLIGIRRRGGATRDVDLGEDVAHVSIDRLLAQEQLLRDGLVGASRCQQA